jgi:hypothetical protein
MKVIRAMVGLLIGVALAGCSRVTATTDHDPSANFGALAQSLIGRGTTW